MVMSKRKSRKFKVLEGNPSGRPLPNEPLPRPVLGIKTPQKLGKYGQKLHKDLSKKLANLGILTELDSYSLDPPIATFYGLDFSRFSNLSQIHSIQPNVKLPNISR
jgi:hypothetical protein